MAVPKKKTSRSKKNSRKAIWKKEILKKVIASLSLGMSITKNNLKNNFFIL